MSEMLRALKEKATGLKYVLIVGLVGLLLLLWPSGQSSGADQEVPSAAEEARLEAVLSQMQGVGQVELLLSDSGAVVVCQGADSAGVCLRVTQAVRCYTGLGADKVQIFKMK